MSSTAGDVLLGLPRQGSGVGLHRVHWLIGESVRELGPGPECIKIVGSKGKGSTAAMLHGILQQLLPCGLFTSPHLEAVEERFRLGDELVTPEALAAAVEWVRATFERRPAWMADDTLGFFEAATATAWRLFSSSGLEVAVVEAGIGGRFDSTRVLPGSLAGLTSVELEHAELLGPTLDHIAYDKAEICPPGGMLVASPTRMPLDTRLHSYCRLRTVDLRWADEIARVRDVRCGPTGTRLSVETDIGDIRDLELPLLGLHQVANAQCAIALACVWGAERHPRDAIADAIRAGLRNVTCPGRFEHIASSPDVFIDVCHTPGSAAASARALHECSGRTGAVLVVGASVDKDVEQIVTALAPAASIVICTRAHHKGAPVDRVARAARAANTSAEVLSAETIEEAMPLALGLAQERSLPVLVAGGLFLAIEARAVLLGRDPAALRFF